MNHAEAEVRLLDAAEELFYARGVHSVGMDDIRARSGVSLKRLYQCFPAKEQLVVAYLRRRDERWRASLAGSVARVEPGTVESVLSVFDWLHDWFAEPGFRGCAFINSVGELGATSPAIVDIAREHKVELKRFLVGLLPGLVADPEATAEGLLLLIDGAIIAAAITDGPVTARHARRSAATLLATE